jgi:hypothetical protein
MTLVAATARIGLQERRRGIAINLCVGLSSLGAIVSMSVLSAISCLLNQHEPLRRDVSWNGRTYIGECRHCGALIERHGRRNWRKRKGTAEHNDAPTPI